MRLLVKLLTIVIVAGIWGYFSWQWFGSSMVTGIGGAILTLPLLGWAIGASDEKTDE
jgi:hypothetical protein